MSSLTTFDSTKEALLDLMRSIKDGKTQLPDFQRGWIWDDQRIRDLVFSISLSYPIGALMMLQTGNASMRLKPRLVEGVKLGAPPEPERLILDGQQRLTSLFQSLFSDQAVSTRDSRGKEIKRYYYIHMAAALDPKCDREDAIFSIPEDRVMRNFRKEIERDYSSPEKEYETGLFPLAQVFACSEWRSGHNEFWDYDKDKLKLFDRFESQVIKRFEQYQIPLILLRKETPKEAICQVFEKVNSGGVPLDVFELLTATYAADDYSLRDDWDERHTRLRKHDALRSLEKTDFLMAATLLATYQRRRLAIDTGVEPEKAPGISCKRKDVLQLTLDEYKGAAERVTQGFERSARLLQAQKIFTAGNVPYRTQLTPLAAIFAVLGDKAESQGVQAKLTQWYWCGVFGELYGGSIETRIAKDLPEVVGWIDGGPQPDTIVDANFAPGRLLSLRTRGSAAYKGLSALLLREGAEDFYTGAPIDVQMYFDDKIDIHHIFPQAWCRQHDIDARRCDCVVNKTPLSAKTNRMVGGNAPSVYLTRVQNKAGITVSGMDDVLQSHVIDPQALRTDDFDAFFQRREQALLRRIEKAMGKPIARNVAEADDLQPVDYQDEDVA